MDREYTIAAIEEIEKALGALRKVNFTHELVGLDGPQLSRLRADIIDLSRLETELGMTLQEDEVDN